MKKKIFGLVLTMLLIAAFSMSAFAEEQTGGSGWAVTYDGNAMNSNFTSANINDAILGLQPGDTVTLSIALSNTSGSSTDWYMQNSVLKSLEDSKSVAEGGAYTYVLSYTKPDGTSTVIYSSDNVGGENATDPEVGLHQATDTLKDYFYLDELQSGASGSISLKVTLEGETQGNNYMDTLAKLQMKFAVEPVVSVTNTKTVLKTVSVKTGDNTNQLLYIAAAALALGVILFLLAFSRMKRKKAAVRDDQRRGGLK